MADKPKTTPKKTTPKTKGPAKAAGAEPRGSRRARYVARSSVLLLAVIAVTLFAGVIAGEVNARIDVTATREHQLSPQTARILDELKGGTYEVIVAADFSARDRQSVERLEDVLSSLRRASPDIKVTDIDTGAPSGREEYDGLVGRLADRFGPEVTRAAERLRDSIADVERIASELASPELAASLRGVASVIEGEPDSREDRVRVAIGQLIERAEQTSEAIVAETEKARGVLDAGGALGGLPDVETAKAVLEPSLVAGANELAALADGMRAIADETTLPDEARARARPLADALSAMRGQAADDIEAFDAIPRLSVLRVARILERSSAALVLAPPGAPGIGITAMELDAMLPPAQAIGGQRVADLRFRTEEILGAALLSVSGRPMPTIVMMHGLAGRLSPNFDGMHAMIDRLELRGMHVEEWAAGVESDPPAIPTGHAVVYMIIPTEAASAQGAIRMGRLADRAARLFERGEAMLICAQPSTLPMRGAPDPMVKFLEQAGVKVETGRPLLWEAGAGSERQVLWELRLSEPRSDHPISATIRGLPLSFKWAVPIRSTGADGAVFGASVTPLLTVEQAALWGESEWLRYSQIPESQRAMPRLDSPTPDTGRDLIADDYTVAAAIDRRTPDGVPQRCVVIGANGWFLDQVTQLAGEVDGRRVLYNPGNLELLESSVLWLAGQGDLLGASASARAAPIIRPIEPGTQNLLRWGLIAGMPALVLMVGGALRLLRG